MPSLSTSLRTSHKRTSEEERLREAVNFQNFAERNVSSKQNPELRGPKMPALNQTALALIAFKLLSYQCPLLLLLRQEVKTNPSKRTAFSPGACCSVGVIAESRGLNQ